jgi:hypothetical protein
MKKNAPFFYLGMAITMAAAFLFPVTAHSQGITATEKTALCQKERQNLDKLNDRLGLISVQLRTLRDFVIHLTEYQAAALKFSSAELDKDISPFSW